MADSKITALTAISTVDPTADPLVIVDVSDTSMAASGTTKKSTINQLLGSGGTATLASATITGAATVGTTFGVTGVSTFAAGTALLPALTTTGDTNTGIYYPAADTFAVTTAGTERYRVDSSGNVGIGVTPSAKLDVQTSAGRFKVENFGVSSVKLTSSGSFGFVATEHQFLLGATQAMTLDASGNLLVGTTSLGSRSTNIFSKSGGFGLEVQQRASGSAGSCLGLTYSVGTPNNATDYFLYCADATTVRAYVVSNGNMLNVNGSYGTISDLRLKENISDARNYLADLLKLRVVKYSLKSEASPTANLIGLIAQEVEQVFPTLVETNADDVKSIKTTVLIPMLLKALQELTARVQTLETR